MTKPRTPRLPPMQLPPPPPLGPAVPPALAAFNRDLAARAPLALGKWKAN